MNQDLYRYLSTIQNEIHHQNELSIADSLSDYEANMGRLKNLVYEQFKDIPEGYHSRIYSEFFGMGPLEPLINDSEITEIIVNGPEVIWFEKNGQLVEHSDQFYSLNNYLNFLDKVMSEGGSYSSKEFPSCDGQFRNFRFSIVRGEITQSNHILTLRRHPENSWTLNQLGQKNWASDRSIEIIKKIISSKKNFLIVGGTGSGKTSILNACLKETASKERSIIIEDTSEIKIPNSVSIKLLTRFDPHQVLTEITQEDLLKKTLRLRPDRIIMGEMRGQEAKDFLMALATGHQGCFGTLHAQSASQALIRLEMLIQLGAPQWSLSAIRKLIQLSLDYIFVTVKNHQGERHLEGIYKLVSLEDSGFLIEPILSEHENVFTI